MIAIMKYNIRLNPSHTKSVSSCDPAEPMKIRNTEVCDYSLLQHRNDVAACLLVEVGSPRSQRTPCDFEHAQNTRRF